ncbi:hypothetical protein RhiirA4_425323 [Rhizophagus irregularis]|uniref:Uncharacterized protein n=1 Tax=Rhizophagus irregularis TaxID=588596 RepID=A0A2I1H0V0_9GLOM|nr:hypothetical protein RhiirA4_425323 [Rhizophagus irregularis]
MDKSGLTKFLWYDKNTGTRIDHVWIPERFVPQLLHCNLHKSEYITDSDHSILTVASLLEKFSTTPPDTERLKPGVKHRKRNKKTKQTVEKHTRNLARWLNFATSIKGGKEGDYNTTDLNSEILAWADIVDKYNEDYPRKKMN